METMFSTMNDDQTKSLHCNRFDQWRHRYSSAALSCFEVQLFSLSGPAFWYSWNGSLLWTAASLLWHSCRHRYKGFFCHSNSRDMLPSSALALWASVKTSGGRNSAAEEGVARRASKSALPVATLDMFHSLRKAHTWLEEAIHRTHPPPFSSKKYLSPLYSHRKRKS